MDKDALRQNKTHGTHSFPLAVYTHDPARDTTVRPHWHEEAEILFFGEGDFAISVDFRVETIHGPAFVFINPGQIHALTLPAGREERAVVFDLAMLSFSGSDAVQHQLMVPLLSGELRLPRIIGWDHPLYPAIREQYDSIFALLPRQTVAAFLGVKICLYHILSLLCGENLFRQAREDRTLEPIKKAMAYIKENLPCPIRLEQLAAVAGMNPQYFCRYFKRITGSTVTEYINDLRVDKAASYLRSTDLLIADIAQQCGFGNQGYFIWRFQRRTGLTPSEYRKKSK